ncbi:nucleotide-sugar transporter-domain-containing protein [Pelagophyceae sp. CCMP2097]|nr:nucleotide-sugar transporter-domain-containing protein [Pelagophyceae sp. CCMP2097]|mmetsp:Transcript_14614/g.49003  ORF Transcript_14614/g.49003 Transcript_14614/m.49003 type:complete len:374 (-) Transcript_14614:260-1381(-)
MSTALNRHRESPKPAEAVEFLEDGLAEKKPAADVTPTFFGMQPKHFVCGLLVLQNTGAVLLMRYTRSMPGEADFITQSAVIVQEMVKGLCCILLLLIDHGTISSAWDVPSEALKTSVPALLYLVQNNLQYVAVGYLDAATYTVSYQTKIVWSGILSVLLLGRQLGAHKWLGIAMLALGVATVQIAGSMHGGGGASSWTSSESAVGLSAVISAAMVSALAGVYFEKILKGAKVGLWTRNLQLAFYSVVIGYAKLATSEHGAALRAGRVTFFHGYTPMTWVCIAANAFGGLLVGAVIKYADAVMKDVALGSSIVLSSLLSTVLFNFQMNAGFVCGIAIVIYSVFLYGQRAHCCGVLSAPLPEPQAPTRARPADLK